MQRWSKRQLHERPIPYSCSELWRWSGSQDVVAVMKFVAYRLTVYVVSGHQRWSMNRESSLNRQSSFGTCTSQVTNIVEIFGPPSRSTQQILTTVYTRAGVELTDPQEGCKLKDIKITSS